MKVVVDKDMQLGLRERTVYFILTPEQEKVYGETISKLNNYIGYTRTIFSFDVLTDVAETEFITQKVADALRKYNMIVMLEMYPEYKSRYKPSYYNYGMARIDLNQPGAEIERCVLEFIDEACQENLKLLQQMLDQNNGQAAIYGGIRSVKGKIEAYRNSLNMKHFQQNIWKKALGENLYVLPRQTKSIAIQHLEEAGLPADKAQDAAEALWRIFSRDLNQQHKDALEKAQREVAEKARKNIVVRPTTVVRGKPEEHIKPNREPEISLEVKKLVSRTQKIDWALVITVDGEKHEVKLGSKESIMLYILTLLSVRKREKLERKVLLDSPNLLYHSGFDSFYWKLWPQYGPTKYNHHEGKRYNRDPHIWNQGKAQVNRRIREALKDCPEAIYYCILTLEKDQKNSFYNIRVKPESVVIPPYVPGI